MTRRLLRVALAVPLLAVGFGAASAAARTGPATPLCAQAASAHHVGIVVEHGDGSVLRQCVGFSSATITALTVLQTSGIENATQTYGSLGAAVCQIDHEPATYSSCLPASGSYWVLFVAHGGGAWTNSAQGVSSTSLSDGDDVGFRYDPLAGADPSPASPAGTCPTSTPTPEPTPTPNPTAVATPTPGATSNPGTPPQATIRPPSVTSSEAAPIVTEGPTATAGSPGVASPAGTAVSTAKASAVVGAPTPFSPGLLLAGGGVVALLVLLGVQGIRRRSR